MDVSLEIITPGSGSTLFTPAGPDFPAVRVALAQGPAALPDRLGAVPAAVVVVGRALDTLPGEALQAAVLEKVPLAVLEGLWLTAFAAGADRAVLAVEAPVPALAGGIAALAALGGPAITVAVVPRSFMASQDAALMRLLEGRPVLASAPRVELRGEAALVRSAVELAGASACMEGACPGLLLQVQGSVERPALVEIRPGTTLREVVEGPCGGVKGGKAFKFALAGGPTGTFLPAGALDLPLEQGGLLQVGGEGDCVVDLARRCLELTAAGNCGICIICREGSHQLMELLADGVSGKTKGSDEALIQELGEGLLAGSLCDIGRRAPGPLLSGLQHFAEEFEAHFKRKRCPALVCGAYVTFHILGETCTGCGKCLDVCPEEAIEGEEDYIHVIDAGACTKCGLCFDICPPEAAAVVKAGPIKPRTPKEPIPVGTWKKR